MKTQMELYLPPLPDGAEGVYVLGRDGSWTHFVLVDGIEDLPHAMLSPLRRMPREELIRAAMGEQGYLIRGERLVGNPLRCVLVVTKRGAEEIWQIS